MRLLSLSVRLTFSTLTFFSATNYELVNPKVWITLPFKRESSYLSSRSSLSSLGYAFKCLDISNLSSWRVKLAETSKKDLDLLTLKWSISLSERVWVKKRELTDGSASIPPFYD